MKKMSLHIKTPNPFVLEMEELKPFPDNTIQINEFLQDSSIPENEIIQAAINKCSTLGGGTVIVPKGNWISKSIHLKSYIHLKIEKGAVISFSDKPSDYLPVVFTRWEGMECYNYSPLIYADTCENIAITGAGILLGNGQSWWHWKQIQQKAAKELCYAESNHIPVAARVYGTEEAALRPSFIQPIRCKNVLIEGITIKDGPQWMIHPVYCENICIRNVVVHSKGHNTDGLNPDSCKNVLIESCSFNTGDDCIAINSGMNEDGWRVNKPCENIVIRNCSMSGGHGGVVIGSAMSGGVRNIYITNCQIQNTDQGIRLKSMRGRGGYVENIWIENIELNSLHKEAIQVNMFYEYSTVMPKSNIPPVFKKINITNVKGDGAEVGIEVIGLPEQLLEEIYLDNISVKAKQAIICKNVKNITFSNINIEKSSEESVIFKNVMGMELNNFKLH